MNEYMGVLKKYATFTGRASRREFWMFTLVNFIIVVVLMVATNAINILGVLYLVYVLGTLVPSLAVGVRRLHDIDKSGWWLLIALVPIVGPIVVLVFYCLKGQIGPNRFGPDPYDDVKEIEQAS